jgi:hypothetical protein
MDYIMIERTIYDAMVSALKECRSVLLVAVNRFSQAECQEWVDNHTAQSILCRSKRSMAMLRTEGKIGYAVIEGKVFYPANEIGRFLTNNYKRYD